MLVCEPLAGSISVLVYLTFAGIIVLFNIKMDFYEVLFVYRAKLV